jgi:hypothetical protein
MTQLDIVCNEVALNSFLDTHLSKMLLIHTKQPLIGNPSDELLLSVENDPYSDQTVELVTNFFNQMIAKANDNGEKLQDEEFKDFVHKGKNYSVSIGGLRRSKKIVCFRFPTIEDCAKLCGKAQNKPSNHQAMRKRFINSMYEALKLLGFDLFTIAGPVHVNQWVSHPLIKPHINEIVNAFRSSPMVSDLAATYNQPTSDDNQVKKRNLEIKSKSPQFVAFFNKAIEQRYRSVRVFVPKMSNPMMSENYTALYKLLNIVWGGKNITVISSSHNKPHNKPLTMAECAQATLGDAKNNQSTPIPTQSSFSTIIAIPGPSNPAKRKPPNDLIDQFNDELEDENAETASIPAETVSIPTQSLYNATTKQKPTDALFDELNQNLDHLQLAPLVSHDDNDENAETGPELCQRLKDTTLTWIFPQSQSNSTQIGDYFIDNDKLIKQNILKNPKDIHYPPTLVQNFVFTMRENSPFDHQTLGEGIKDIKTLCATIGELLGWGRSSFDPEQRSEMVYYIYGTTDYITHTLYIGSKSMSKQHFTQTHHNKTHPTNQNTFQEAVDIEIDANIVQYRAPHEETHSGLHRGQLIINGFYFGSGLFLNWLWCMIRNFDNFLKNEPIWFLDSPEQQIAFETIILRCLKVEANTGFSNLKAYY